MSGNFVDVLRNVGISRWKLSLVHLSALAS